MSYRTNEDNIYKEGTIVRARVNPGLKLIIVKYYQRIYYCAVVGEPDRKHFALFEKELIPPTAKDNPEQFTRVETRLDMVRKALK